VHGLRDRGYVEGRNLIIERRTGEGKVERYREVVAELAQLHVDIIAVASTQVAIAAKQATSTIPIVCVCGNAVESGLVASLARPGANVTGVSNVPAWTLAAKRLALFKEAIPRLSRVAVIYQPIIPDQRDQLNEFARAARALNITLVSEKADRPDDFPSAYAAIARERVDGFVPADNPINYAQRRQLVDFAAQNRLPAFYAQREFVDGGGLMSYGANLPDLYRALAGYVDKILKGAKPADLPVEQPTKFELVINAKTAKALRLTIPPSVLLRADQVIE
jgi:putative tryptophan/tyrosine transport system substrate-binding protein